MIKKLLPALLLLVAEVLSAQLTPIVDSIPMSDGKKLAADVYIPSGMSSGPVILVQTPYNRLLYRIGGLPLVGHNLNTSNYIFVIVDWRGFYGSAAALTVNPPAKGLDGYNCVEWIAQQSWCNGKIGMHGASALGRIQFQTAEYNPPHLTCMVPLVAGPQYTYYEYFPNGDLRTEYVEQLDALGFGLKTALMANPVYSPAWQYTENQNFYPDSIRVPCFMMGGWYDHNIKDMLEFFPAICNSHVPDSVKSQHRLLMGPWVHGGHSIAKVGTAQQGQLSYPNAAGWNDSLALLFFDYHLRGVANNWDQSPVVQYYQMGDNTWQNAPSWPLTGINAYRNYLVYNNLISFAPPVSPYYSVPITYDPSNPSPTYGGPTLRSDLAQGPYDQADTIESRNDVAIFSTEVLGEPAVLRGNVVVHLKVSSNRFDTDFDIRLTDVYPDGRSMLVNDGCQRMRFLNGNSAADTSAIIPGHIYDCNITLPYTCNTFLPGHRIRVDITSSNYPRFNRNMNTDGPMYPGNSLDSLVNPLIASNTVYTNSINASYIELPLVNFTSGIAEQQNAFNVRVFPNPASTQLFVQFEKESKGSIELFDVLGKRVVEKVIDGQNNTISTAGLANGVYMLRTTGENSFTKKVLISR